jgi:hypothetical protein
MTDASQALASLPGEGGLLVLYCSSSANSTINAEVQFQGYLGSGSYPVHYRIDSGAPITGIWRDVFTGTMHAVSPNANQVVPFVLGIQNGERLVVQAETYQRNSRGMVAVFDLAGASEITDRLRQFCGISAVASSSGKRVQDAE